MIYLRAQHELDRRYTAEMTAADSCTVDLGLSNAATFHQITVERGSATTGTVKVRAVPLGMTTDEGYVKDIDGITDLVFSMSTANKRTVRIFNTRIKTFIFELAGANGTMHVAVAGIR